MDHLLSLIAAIAVFLPGLNSHDLIATEMWPLTSETNGQEVLKKTGHINASLPHPAEFLCTEPTLNYPALSLAGGLGATITLQDEMKREKVSIVGMFYVDPCEQLVFFQYTSRTGLEFRVYVNRCTLHIESREEDLMWYISNEVCDRKPHWYTVSAAWKENKLEVAMIWAKPNEDEGTTVMKEKGEHNFEHYPKSLPANGELVIGSNATGKNSQHSAVCCVRIYDEDVGEDHVKKQMYSNCKRQASWEPGANPSPCTSETCKNSATCIVEKEDNYTCQCRPWNAGRHCEKHLWMAKQEFRLAGRCDVSHSIPTIQKFVNVTVRSKRECASLCLQQNICLSFQISLDSKCTLFSDSLFDTFEPNDHFKYYISSDQFS